MINEIASHRTTNKQFSLCGINGACRHSQVHRLRRVRCVTRYLCDASWSLPHSDTRSATRKDAALNRPACTPPCNASPLALRETDAIHHSHNDRQRTPYFVVKIQLTHKTVFLILPPRKSKFLLKKSGYS